jgi:capsular exopolysaccharide synthesis family protein
MTTLPQTTTIRLPRPAGQNSLAIGPQPPTIAYGQTTASHLTGNDVWRVIRSNLWLIVTLVVVGGVAGYFLNRYLAKYHSRYTATGYIQISSVIYNNDLLGRGAQPMVDNGNLAVDQKTQAQLLRQEALISRVVQNPESDLRQTEWFKQFNGDVRRMKEDLTENYAVSALPESRLLAISMSYSRPRDCKTIIETIVNQHLEDQRKISQDRNLDRSVQLNNLKQKYQFRLRDLQTELREKVVHLSIDGMGTAGRLGTKDLELEDLLRRKFDLVRDAESAKSALDNTMQQIRQGIDPPQVKMQMERDNDVVMLTQQLMSYDLELGRLGDLGPDHKIVKSIKKSQSDVQRKLDDIKNQRMAQGTSNLLEGLQQTVSSNEQEVKDLEERIASVKQELGEMTYSMNQYLTSKDEEATTRELLKQVSAGLDAISQVNEKTEALSGLQWAGRPETPDSPSFPKLPVTMGLAIALGLGLGVGIAFLRELMDTSVRSPRDIARVGQLNLLGIIPHEGDDPQAEGAPLPLVISHAPHSMLAESFRQVRTRLQHAASLDSTRSILVTSPGPGDGKSTIACNIAAGLALNGRKILLVDANFRRPELHKIFSVGNETGFSTVLNSIGNFESSLVQTQVPNLDLLPSGPRPANAAELLESQLLIDFIERALEEYDHVIFDSGPMLFVSETTALAPRVDGVVTVVKARKNSRGLLQRMRDALRQVKAEHLGVILNGVRAQAGGYYNRNMKTYYAYQDTEVA